MSSPSWTSSLIYAVFGPTGDKKFKKDSRDEGLLISLSLSLECQYTDVIVCSD